MKNGKNVIDVSHRRMNNPVKNNVTQEQKSQKSTDMLHLKKKNEHMVQKQDKVTYVKMNNMAHRKSGLTHLKKNDEEDTAGILNVAQGESIRVADLKKKDHAEQKHDHVTHVKKNQGHRPSIGGTHLKKKDHAAEQKLDYVSRIRKSLAHTKNIGRTHIKKIEQNDDETVEMDNSVDDNKDVDETEISADRCPSVAYYEAAIKTLETVHRLGTLSRFKKKEVSPKGSAQSFYKLYHDLVHMSSQMRESNRKYWSSSQISEVPKYGEEELEHKRSLKRVPNEAQRRKSLINKILKLDQTTKEVVKSQTNTNRTRMELYEKLKTTEERLLKAIGLQCSLMKKIEEKVVKESVGGYAWRNEGVNLKIKINTHFLDRYKQHHLSFSKALKRLYNNQYCDFRTVNHCNKTRMNALYNMVGREKAVSRFASSTRIKRFKFARRYYDNKEMMLNEQFRQKLKETELHFASHLSDMKHFKMKLIRQEIKNNTKDFQNVFATFHGINCFTFGKIVHLTRLLNELKVEESYKRTQQDQCRQQCEEITAKFYRVQGNVWELQRIYNQGFQVRKKMTDIVKEQKSLKTKKQIALIKLGNFTKQMEVMETEHAQEKEEALMAYFNMKREFFKRIHYASEKVEYVHLHSKQYSHALQELYQIETGFEDTTKKTVIHDDKRQVQIEIKTRAESHHTLRREYKHLLNQALLSLRFLDSKLKNQCLHKDDLGFSFDQFLKYHHGRFKEADSM